MTKEIKRAAEIIKSSKPTIAFTGAGISVESGIPPFRGRDGLWNKYNPDLLEIGYFLENPHKSWEAIKEIFFSFMENAKPNKAHLTLAQMEKNGLLKSIITQNIDNLHFEAGSINVREFHGNAKTLRCMDCGKIKRFEHRDLEKIPPRCGSCRGCLKPDFVFFGEPVPLKAGRDSFLDAEEAQAVIIIGSTGEVYPAAMIPEHAKSMGASIIEINIEPSLFTRRITDVFLQGKAGEIMGKIGKKLGFRPISS